MEFPGRYENHTHPYTRLSVAFFYSNWWMWLTLFRLNGRGVREGLGILLFAPIPCPPSPTLNPASGEGLAPRKIATCHHPVEQAGTGAFREALGLHRDDQGRSCRNLLQLVWRKAAVSEGTWQGSAGRVRAQDL